MKEICQIVTKKILSWITKEQMKTIKKDNIDINSFLSHFVINLVQVMNQKKLYENQLNLRIHELDSYKSQSKQNAHFVTTK